MRLFRFLIGLLLLPVCVAVTRATVQLALSLPITGEGLFPPAALALCGGIALWLVVYYTLPTPARTYILAHELTHALWGALMGARVKDLKVSRTGGSVTLSESNLLITLAPYFFPFYTVLVLLGYVALSFFVNVAPYYLLWMGLVGLTWGFHLTFTITTLLQHQSDIAEYGALFSYGVIYIFNIVGVGLWIVAISPATVADLYGWLRLEFCWQFGLMWNWLQAAARHSNIPG